MPAARRAPSRSRAMSARSTSGPSGTRVTVGGMAGQRYPARDPPRPTLAPVRRTAAAIFILLAAVLPAVAVASWWGYGEATDTDRFMSTAAPLATDATVQRQVADELVAAVGGSDPAVAAQARTLVAQVAGTPAYRAAWRATQRSVHARMATRLQGDVDAPLTLDLGRLAAVLRARLAATGRPELAQAIGEPGSITIVDRADVRRAHDAVQATRVIRAFAIPGAVLALIGVLLTAPSAAAGLLRAGGCLLVSAALLLGARALGHEAATADSVTAAVYDVLTRPLTAWIVGGAAAGALAVLAGGLAAAARRPVGGRV